MTDAFIFVISSHSAASPECRKELDHALALDKRVVPVVASMIDRTKLPAGLPAFQFVPPRERRMSPHLPLPDALRQRLILAPPPWRLTGTWG